jgi:hypothetical protein
MDSMSRLQMLECLRPRRRAEALQTHRDVIEWQAAVAPLLDFDDVYHRSFARLGEIISTPGLSSDAYEPAFRGMESIMMQAIDDLQARTDTSAR